MPKLLAGLGAFLLAVALFFWREGSGWGLFIAWVCGTWGGMFMAWGLIVGWYRSVAACVAGSAFASAAMLVSLLCVQHDARDLAIPCAIGSGLALTLGVYQVCYLLRRRG